MEVKSDFKELLALLNGHNVEYVIDGALALAFHGAPRYTGDMDVYVRPTRQNARRTVTALREFGFETTGLRQRDFEAPDIVVQLGFLPVRIDRMTSISGVGWDEVQRGAVAGMYGDVLVRYIGRAQYIANKRVMGRKKDAFDLEALGAG